MFNFLLIAMVVLTACGSEPDPPSMDRRYLSGDFLEQEKKKLLEAIEGDVLDQIEWVHGESKVFTILSREYEAGTAYRGIFLRQYDLSGQHATLLWTYQDSLSCATVAGQHEKTAEVTNRSPCLRPLPAVDKGTEGFVLAYDLRCRPTEAARNVVVIDAVSGTPAVRLGAANGAVTEAEGLHDLPEDLRSDLLALLNS